MYTTIYLSQAARATRSSLPRRNAGKIERKSANSCDSIIWHPGEIHRILNEADRFKGSTTLMLTEGPQSKRVSSQISRTHSTSCQEFRRFPWYDCSQWAYVLISFDVTSFFTKIPNNRGRQKQKLNRTSKSLQKSTFIAFKGKFYE